MGLFSSSEFDELSLLVQKATSEYIPAAQEDLALNLEVTDIIKSKRVTPKDALRLLLGRLTHENPNVQLLTLQLLDKCVKNAGKHFLVEMAGREFVDVAVSMMDDEEYGNECNQIVQDRLIELFQEWALIFQSDPSLSYLYDTYSNLKTQKRVIFPVPSNNLDQVDPLSIVYSLAPPEWTDSPTCQRCRDSFTMTNRKHHCRKCGGTFCQLCSSNEMALLEMGISEPVRVCDTCYRQPTEKRTAKVFEKKREPFEDSVSEDSELKKAIEISLKEQGGRTETISEDDLALKKAIEASLKETGPNHISTQSKTTESESQPSSKDALKYFNPVELENISMFHQLIGRLVRTRPSLTSEDASDLKKLAQEMRRLQKRPVESENVKIQLEESLRGYELLFGVAEPAGSESDIGSSSKDLNQMRAEIIGPVVPSGPVNEVRSRLGSLSLENQKIIGESSEILPKPLSVHVPQPAYHYNTPEPGPVSITGQTTLYSHTQAQQIPVPLQPSPHFRAHRQLSPPQIIQFCPEMTVHPHPVHPFTHENPYALKNASVNTDVDQRSNVKKVSKKKTKSSAKKKKKDKEEEASKRSKKKKKKSKKEKKQKEKKDGSDDSDDEKRVIVKKHKNNKDSESGKKRIKKSERSEHDGEKAKKRKRNRKAEKEKEEKKKDNEDKSTTTGTATTKPVKTEPINLIDL